MAPAVEHDRHPVILDGNRPGGLYVTAIELLRGGLLEALQPRRQPAVAAVGDHRQGGIEVDVQPHLAGQAIEVEEVHADPKAVLDPVAARVADDQLARRLLEVIGQEERGAAAAQAGHGDLTDRALIAAQPYRLLDVTNPDVTALGYIDHRLLPRGGRPVGQATEDRDAPAADGDEMDPAQVDARELGVVEHLAVEVEPPRVGAGDR